MAQMVKARKRSLDGDVIPSKEESQAFAAFIGSFAQTPDTYVDGRNVGAESEQGNMSDDDPMEVFRTFNNPQDPSTSNPESNEREDVDIASYLQRKLTQLSPGSAEYEATLTVLGEYSYVPSPVTSTDNELKASVVSSPSAASAVSVSSSQGSEEQKKLLPPSRVSNCINSNTTVPNVRIDPIVSNISMSDRVSKTDTPDVRPDVKNDADRVSKPYVRPCVINVDHIRDDKNCWNMYNDNPRHTLANICSTIMARSQAAGTDQFILAQKMFKRFKFAEMYGAGDWDLKFAQTWQRMAARFKPGQANGVRSCVIHRNIEDTIPESEWQVKGARHQKLRLSELVFIAKLITQKCLQNCDGDATLSNSYFKHPDLAARYRKYTRRSIGKCVWSDEYSRQHDGNHKIIAITDLLDRFGIIVKRSGMDDGHKQATNSYSIGVNNHYYKKTAGDEVEQEQRPRSP